MKHIGAKALYDRLTDVDAHHGDCFLLDVRTRPEYARRRVACAINIPLDELIYRHSELPHGQEIITICEHGIRSQSAAGLLMQLGFENVTNMLGGMSQWQWETQSDIA